MCPMPLTNHPETRGLSNSMDHGPETMDQGSNHSNEIKLNTGTRLNNRFVLELGIMKKLLGIVVLGFLNLPDPINRCVIGVKDC